MCGAYLLGRRDLGFLNDSMSTWVTRSRWPVASEHLYLDLGFWIGKGEDMVICIYSVPFFLYSLMETVHSSQNTIS